MSAFEPTKASFESLLRERDDNVDLISFEKDWHLVRVFGALTRFAGDNDTRFVFTGGTSLSKRGVISRFSEDADFLVVVPTGQMPGRGASSKARKALVSYVEQELPAFETKLSRSFDGGHQQLLELLYPTVCTTSRDESDLRPHIRLEMRYVEGDVDATLLPVRSLVNETLSLPAEVALETLSPLVIAANKLVGLAWRVMRRGSGDAKEEDRNLVRHLHDLAALEQIIQDSRERFSALVAEVIQSDRPRYAELNIVPEDLLLKAKQLITEDARYEQEYNRFVTRMSFAPISKRLPAADAFAAYRRIVDIARA